MRWKIVLVSLAFLLVLSSPTVFSLTLGNVDVKTVYAGNNTLTNILSEIFNIPASLIFYSSGVQTIGGGGCYTFSFGCPTSYSGNYVIGCQATGGLYTYTGGATTSCSTGSGGSINCQLCCSNPPSGTCTLVAQLNYGDPIPTAPSTTTTVQTQIPATTTNSTTSPIATNIPDYVANHPLFSINWFRFYIFCGLFKAWC